MMKEEFEKLIGEEVKSDEYELIEMVYTWHPAIGDKQDIADLYKRFGISVIRGMEEVAVMEMELDKTLKELDHQRSLQMRRKEFIDDGNTVLEQAIADVWDAYMEIGDEAELVEELGKIKEDNGYHFTVMQTATELVTKTSFPSLLRR